MFREITAGAPLPEPKPYLVEGLGTDRPVGAYEAEYIDEVLVFSDRDSFLAARRLGHAWLIWPFFQYPERTRGALWMGRTSR